MNIGIFTDTYLPQINGVVTVIRNLEKGLKERGHNVYIFTIKHPNADSKDNIIRVPSMRFFREPQHRIGTPLSLSLQNKVKNLELDIIHTHTEFSMWVQAVQVAKKYKVPMVHTMHTMYDEYVRYYSPLVEYLMKDLFDYWLSVICRASNMLIAPSVKVKKLLLNYYDKTPVTVVPNGIDLSSFYDMPEDDEEKRKGFRKRFGIKEKEKVMIFVGRMGKEKSVDNLIYNIKHLSEFILDVKLLLVGDGPEKKNFELLASELGVSENVIFTGYLDWPDEISLAYRSSDIFISASHTEIHPITFIEAMASKLPVVAYDDSSIKNMVINDVNGYKYKSKKEMWKGMKTILENEDIKTRMSKKSYEMSGEYTVDRFTENTLKLYKKVKEGFPIN
ncbi:MAG: glycosyltransferase [Kosmotogaceae bacterium]